MLILIVALNYLYQHCAVQLQSQQLVFRYIYTQKSFHFLSLSHSICEIKLVCKMQKYISYVQWLLN